jgi:hypothetical protein
MSFATVTTVVDNVEIRGDIVACCTTTAAAAADSQANNTRQLFWVWC